MTRVVKCSGFVLTDPNSTGFATHSGSALGSFHSRPLKLKLSEFWGSGPVSGSTKTLSLSSVCAIRCSRAFLHCLRELLTLVPGFSASFKLSELLGLPLSFEMTGALNVCGLRLESLYFPISVLAAMCSSEKEFGEE